MFQRARLVELFYLDFPSQRVFCRVLKYSFGVYRREAWHEGSEGEGKVVWGGIAGEKYTEGDKYASTG